MMELRKAGVEVCVFQDNEKPEKPGETNVQSLPKLNFTDAIFPNNWISCHETGEVGQLSGSGLLLSSGHPLPHGHPKPEDREETGRGGLDQPGLHCEPMPLYSVVHGPVVQVTKVLDLSHHEEQGRYLEVKQL